MCEFVFQPPPLPLGCWWSPRFPRPTSSVCSCTMISWSHTQNLIETSISFRIHHLLHLLLGKTLLGLELAAVEEVCLDKDNLVHRSSLSNSPYLLFLPLYPDHLLDAQHINKLIEVLCKD